MLIQPGEPTLVTEEGVAAWNNAIDALQQARPRSAFIWDDGLAIAAQDHCNDTGPKGIMSHTGTDGSKVWHRIARYGKSAGLQGENLSFGSTTAIDYMMSLFIDDGVRDRGHRSNVWNTQFHKTGIASCDHKSEYKHMVVIVYADAF